MQLKIRINVIDGTSLEFPARNSEKNFIMSHEAEVLIKFNDDL